MPEEHLTHIFHPEDGGINFSKMSVIFLNYMVFNPQDHTLQPPMWELQIQQLLITDYHQSLGRTDDFQGMSHRKKQITYQISYTLLLFMHVTCLSIGSYSLCYINIPRKKLYICDPQTQLNNFFTPPKTHYMFWPLRAIFKRYFLRFLTLLQHIHHLYKCEAIYCFLICMYVYNAKEVFKHTTFYIGLHKMHILCV
jgi:hypothetical protein